MKLCIMGKIQHSISISLEISISFFFFFLSLVLFVAGLSLVLGNAIIWIQILLRENDLVHKAK